MGPIEKKINELLLRDGLSKETKDELFSIIDDIRSIEKTLINNSYYKGYTDCELKKSPVWDQYSNAYRKYLPFTRIGNLK